MTKKQWVALAESMKSARVLDVAQWEEDVKTFAWGLARFCSIPTFDRMKFLDIAGVGNSGRKQ